MSYYFSPIGNTQTIDANGDPLVGGTISTYLAGTSTAKTTYTDDTGGTSQGVVMTLNSLGYPTNGPVWMLGGVPLKFIIKNAAGVTQSTFDDISGIGDTAIAADQWVLYGAAPTYISATSFSVVGDQTNTFQYSAASGGRRIKSTNSGGTIYSVISASVFSAGVTTVTVVNDSGILDSGMSAVSYGLLSALNPSIPTLGLVPGVTATAGDNSTKLATTAFVNTGTHKVVVHSGNGHGSTNTKIRRFTTAMTNTGTAIVYADSAANGATFTIAETAFYAIQYTDNTAAGPTVNGISLNSAELTTSVISIVVATRLSISAPGTGAFAPAVFVGKLTAGDVIRAHTNGTADDTSSTCYFSIEKVGNV